MPNAKFFNCVDFDVNFRLVWLPNNPAIKLKPGQIIEGPFELLITYNFLRPIQQQNINPINYPTQDSQGNFSDGEIQKDVNEQNRLAQKHKETFIADSSPAKTYEEKDQQVVDGWESLTLPFDPTSCNWVKIPIDQMEKAANILGVEFDPAMPTQKRKWALVKKIKAAIGKS